MSRKIVCLRFVTLLFQIFLAKMFYFYFKKNKAFPSLKAPLFLTKRKKQFKMRSGHYAPLNLPCNRIQGLTNFNPYKKHSFQNVSQSSSSSSSLPSRRKEFWQVSSFIHKQAERLHLQIVSSKTLAGAGSLDINVGFKSCSCIDHPLVSGEGRFCKLHKDFFQTLSL